MTQSNCTILDLPWLHLPKLTWYNRFVRHFNTAFPIFDGDIFWNSYISYLVNGQPTPSVICQIYATSLIYWKHIEGVGDHHKPNVAYVSTLGAAALDEEFTAPSLSTITAALIHLTGRPAFSAVESALNCARTVSLANCLGFNRDPTKWNIHESEKSHRIRAWWGVLVNDRW